MVKAIHWQLIAFIASSPVVPFKGCARALHPGEPTPGGSGSGCVMMLMSHWLAVLPHLPQLLHVAPFPWCRPWGARSRARALRVLSRIGSAAVFPTIGLALVKTFQPDHWQKGGNYELRDRSSSKTSKVQPSNHPPKHNYSKQLFSHEMEYGRARQG